MGRICIKLDDHYERFLRRESANLGISLSELVRKNLKQSYDSEIQKNCSTSDTLPQLTAEILELRKELRIVTGALVKIMEANGLTIDEMKNAGKEFYRERV